MLRRDRLCRGIFPQLFLTFPLVVILFLPADSRLKTSINALERLAYSRMAAAATPTVPLQLYGEFEIGKIAVLPVGRRS